MYVLIWEYRVKAGRVTQFERLYSSDGEWAKLFGNDDGYLGTELLHDVTSSERYFTLDRWISSEAYDRFRAKWAEAYEMLDTRGDDLIEHESFLGALTSVQTGG